MFQIEQDQIFNFRISASVTESKEKLETKS